MQTITLKVADNGVIKEVKDDNINAGGEIYESVQLYEFNIDQSSKKIGFIRDLCVDIGMDFGNSKRKDQIQIEARWGEHYTPNITEINNRIKDLEREIQILRGLPVT